MTPPTAHTLAEVEWLKGVSQRFDIGVSEHERGSLCNADARLLWGELDDACRSTLELAARDDCISVRDNLEQLAARLEEKKDRIREMF